MDTRFFERKRAAAVLKHGLLKRYLPKFAGKTGSSCGRAVYLDAFAGEGIYEDGHSGSPVLAAETAGFFKEKGRPDLRCFYIERDENRFGKLQSALDVIDHNHETYCAEASERIRQILVDIGNAPLFAFLDPFGLVGLKFDDLVLPILSRDRRPLAGAPSEVLLNFSIHGLNRLAGNLKGRFKTTTRAKAASTIIEKLNESLGGSWWQTMWTSPGPNRVRRIADEYRRRLADSAGPGWCSWLVSVAGRPGGPALYFLIFFTRSDHGLWEFNECLSLATEEFRRFCAAGQQQLLNVDDMLIKSLVANVRSLLAEKARFNVISEFTGVFGGALGDARTTHLRKALRQLHAEGLIRKPIGKFGPRLMIERA